MLGTDGEYQLPTRKASFDSCASKQSAVNYSIEKLILHNFVSLTTIYCPRLQVELNYSISSFYETQQYYNASLCVSNTYSFRVLLTSLC